MNSVKINMLNETTIAFCYPQFSMGHFNPAQNTCIDPFLSMLRKTLCKVVHFNIEGDRWKCDPL